jgi:hypothetical protein
MGLQMPRTYLVFGDIEGKLDVLRVECTKCERKKYGSQGNLLRDMDAQETQNIAYLFRLPRLLGLLWSDN